MEGIIATGQAKAVGGLENILKEYDLRRDYLLPSKAIEYDTDLVHNEVALTLPTSKKPSSHRLTDYALGQLLAKIKMPRTFYDTLSQTDEPWAMELLRENMRDLTDGLVKEKMLFRIVDGRVKGILSNQYRRMDASPIFETFVKQGLKSGLVPFDGMNTDTRYHVKMLHPEVYEPITGEVVGFGLSITTSDYGAGALQMQMFLMRVWCTNLAIGEDVLRKIHIGKRFDDSDMALSNRTYELDTKAVASAVQDLVGTSFGKRVDQTLAMIKKNAEKEIDPTTALKNLYNRRVLDKKQVEVAQNLYDNAGEELLPASSSMWRLSNTLSLMANGKVDGDTSLRLQEAAFAVLS